jgi:hypothetical protein
MLLRTSTPPATASAGPCSFPTACPSGSLVQSYGHDAQAFVGGFDLVENDIAVIEITSFNNVAARGRFIALQGLPLSGGNAILVGKSSQPLV